MTDEVWHPERMRIELLYFDGCPTYRRAERNLKEALAAERLGARVSLVAVDTGEDARRLRFPGSPTIRVDGGDLFPIEVPDLPHAGGPEGRPHAPDAELRPPRRRRRRDRRPARSGRGPAYGGRGVTRNGSDRDPRGQRSPKPTDEGSTARRLRWAVVGAVAYTIAYVAAKAVFGF